jgi:WD40 repeat protein
LAFFPDYRSIVLKSDDETIKIYDMETGANIAMVPGGDVFSPAAFSPDGRRIVSKSGTIKVYGEPDEASGWPRVLSETDTLKVWDVESGKELVRLDNGIPAIVKACAFSPDGRRIVAGSGELRPTGWLKVWDAATGKELFCTNNYGTIADCVFSPCGRRIALARWPNYGAGTLEVLDAEAGKEMFKLSGHSDALRACAYSPDGRYIVSGSNDQKLKIWDTGTGEEVAELRGHRSSVEACAFSPDGHRIVSGSSDQTIKVWDVGTSGKQTTLTGRVIFFFSPDGLHIVLSGSEDQKPKIWDAKTGEKPNEQAGGIKAIKGLCAFSPDGRYIVSESKNKLKVWNAKTGKRLATLSRAGRFRAYSPDGGRIISDSPGSGTTLQLWDVETGINVATLMHERYISTCAFSPDGRRIVSGSFFDHSTLKVWDSKTGELLLTLARKSSKSTGVSTCAFSPDGRRIVAGYRGKYLKIWDAEKGEELAILRGHSGEVNVCAYSPDGRRIVSGTTNTRSSIAGELKIWNAEVGKELATLSKPGGWHLRTGTIPPRGMHTGGVIYCTFSLDGRRIVSGSKDASLKIWDAETKEELATFFTDFGLNRVVIDPTGQGIAISDYRTLYILRIMGMDSRPPLVTPVRLYLHTTQAWNSHLTTKCAWCGKYFPVTHEILKIIKGFAREANLSPDQSPCLKLPDEAWEDPQLLSECPQCHKPLKFNPFVVDNKGRY